MPRPRRSIQLDPSTLEFDEEEGVAYASGEWVPYGDTALYADLPSLAYGLELLQTGTEIYVDIVDIVVTHFGGNQLIAAATFPQE